MITYGQGRPPSPTCQALENKILLLGKIPSCAVHSAVSEESVSAFLTEKSSFVSMTIQEISMKLKLECPISYSHLCILLCSDNEKATSLAIYKH